MKTDKEIQVNHIGNFTGPSTEGMTKISGQIMNWFPSQVYKSHTAHIHSGGIEQALKYDFKQNKGDTTIYSLYTNLTLNWFQRMKGLKEQGKIIGFDETKRALTKIVFYDTISSLIPLWFKRKLLERFDTVVVPTRYLKEQLNLPNVTVIPFGIDTSIFVPPKQRNNKVPVISYIGAIGNAKGMLDVIDAHHILEDFHDEYELRMYFSSLPGKIKTKGLFKDIIVHGKQDDLIQMYHDTDILIVPHRTLIASIGIPLVMLEGMACGCTLAVANLPHLIEVGGDSVRYFRTGYSLDLADVMLDLVLHPERSEKLKHLARERVVRHYNLKQMGDKYERLYKKM